MENERAQDVTASAWPASLCAGDASICLCVCVEPLLLCFLTPHTLPKILFGMFVPIYMTKYLLSVSSQFSYNMMPYIPSPISISCVLG